MTNSHDVKRDGVVVEHAKSYDDAWLWIMRRQGQSVHWALEHEGYAIEECADPSTCPKARIDAAAIIGEPILSSPEVYVSTIVRADGTMDQEILGKQPTFGKALWDDMVRQARTDDPLRIVRYCIRLGNVNGGDSQWIEGGSYCAQCDVFSPNELHTCPPWDESKPCTFPRVQCKQDAHVEKFEVDVAASWVAFIPGDTRSPAFGLCEACKEEAERGEGDDSLLAFARIEKCGAPTLIAEPRLPGTRTRICRSGHHLTPEETR